MIFFCKICNKTEEYPDEKTAFLKGWDIISSYCPECVNSPVIEKLKEE